MSDPTADQTWDVIVIGAGPVGENAADRAHKGGLSVVVVEKHLVGGECSFYACSPSKALLRPIHVTRASQRVQGSEGARVERDGVLARRDAWINDLDDSGQVGWLDHVGIELVRGEATLVGERLVRVGERTLGATQAVILCTGSAPLVPDLPGLRDANPWTNREATTAKTVPERLVILGGGVVACEMAQVFAALGSRVTLLERGSRLLGRTEDFAGEAVEQALREDGVEIRLDTSAVAVRRPTPGGEVTVSLDSGGEVVADEVLVAVGRVPASRGIGLESVDAETNNHGYVVVNDRMEVAGARGDRTWLYAVGDVIGLALLTHMGKYQARAVGDLVAARGAGRPDDLPSMRPYATGLGSPQVIFTDPEVAAAGLTAAEARQRGIPVRVVDVAMDAAAGSGLQAEGYQGQARLVVDEQARVVVGATFVGQDVAELAHAATIAIVGRVSLDDLWHAVPSYPTMSEIWLRLLEEYGL